MFRTTFSAGPPAHVPPLEVRLSPEAKPVHMRLQMYSADQRSFFKQHVADLETCGMVLHNPNFIWTRVPLLLPKPGPVRFCFTVDLRPVNKFTLVHQYPMPNLELELTKTSKSLFYSIFDLSHGYWQFQLETESQECQSFVTPYIIYTPTPLLHNTNNALTYLQSTLDSILPTSLCHNILY